MKRNMKQWLTDIRRNPVKKAMPILSFPSTQLMGITVTELISSSDRQAEGMKRIADRTDCAAAVSMMDLSVEAECFGSSIRFAEDEVPTAVGGIVSTQEEADALAVPEVGAGRTGIYLEAARKAAGLIQDRPVFAGAIGPFSLTGRLMDVTQVMIYCYEEPDMVHTLLDKACQFLIAYCKAYKETGVNGVVIAEPLTGLLSPTLAEEFSRPYVRRIVDAVQDENFIVIYHNCGGATIQMIDSILATGASAFHFGNAISMAEMMKRLPPEVIACGNVDPAREFRNGTPESVAIATRTVLAECGQYPNFVISSGCDIPPLAGWDNIDAFFAAVEAHYAQK